MSENTEQTAKPRHVVLNQFLRPGDEVIVQPGDDANYEDLPPEGTRCFVVGHHIYDRYISRKDQWMRRPHGVYRCFGAVIVQYETEVEGRFGKEHKTVYRHVSPHHLVMADQSIDLQATRRDTHEWKMQETGVRISDLPELPVMEGDKIRLTSERQKGRFPNDEARVEGIDYTWGHHIFRITPEEGGWTTNVSAEDFELVERGNYYWYEKDKSKLQFKDLKEKASFYTSIGEREQLRNPASGDYSWSLKEGLAAIRNGEADVMSVFHNPFEHMGPPRERPERDLLVFTFPNLPELGKELREATLAGFAEADKAA